VKRVASGVAAALLLLAGDAAAQQRSQFITNNDYRIELFQGPLLAPIRVTGLGGAYIALAEGVEGGAVNAAAPAVREAFSHGWFDYEIAAGISIPGAFARTDFDNRGVDRGQVGNFVDFTFGGQFQFGYFGLSATGDLQRYELSSTTSASPGLDMDIGRWKGLAAYSILHGQLVLGGGVRVVTLQISDRSSGNSIFSTAGVGPELGGLLMPDGRPWRIGATFRAPSIFSAGSDNAVVDPNGVRRAGSFILPTDVVMPWEVEVGFAYQIGPRPLNPPWYNPHIQEAPFREEIEDHRTRRAQMYAQELASTPPAQRPAKEAEQKALEKRLRDVEDQRLDAESKRLYEVRKARYANWPREKILLLASLLVTGKTGSGDRAISVQSFIDQNLELVGNEVSFTPRLGIEGEPIKERLRGRVGTYIEPSRYDQGSARQHFTFGGDVRLFPFNAWGLVKEMMWRVSFFLDVAPRYTNGGIGIGAWH
jgi:hypothetical protein